MLWSYSSDVCVCVSVEIVMSYWMYCKGTMLVCGHRLSFTAFFFIFYSSFSWSCSFRPPDLQVWDVSLFQHTWFKWMGCYQASAELDSFIWIRCVGREKHLRYAGQGIERTRIGNHFYFSISFWPRPYPFVQPVSLLADRAETTFSSHSQRVLSILQV